MDPKQFGPKLRELREAAGLSQKELAERSGLSQNGISHWERGDREPGWSAVLALAEALGVDVSAFVGRGRPRKTT
jgi:transcriptional regulator with XRE-family HTH domain